MAKLLVKNPDGTEDEREFDGELVAGRSSDCELVLTEGGVSRRHARFFLEEGKVVVEDVGSSNGTYVDGERLVGPTVLEPASKVTIGDHELSLAPAPRRASPSRSSNPKETRFVPKTERGPEGPRALPPPSAEGEAQAEGPQLRGLTGIWVNQVYPISGLIVLGRASGVDVQLDDDSVSRRHAEVEATAGGVIIRDLGSANGTSVNGKPIEHEVELETGDIVQLGVVELAFEGARVKKSARKSQASGRPGKRRLVLIVAVAVLVLLGVSAGVKIVGSRAVTPPGDPKLVPVVDSTAELSEQLSICRSFSSPEIGEPNWDRAEAACNKALDIDPINLEGNQLLKRIRVEKECAELFAQGEQNMARLREEEALDNFAAIGDDCSYYYRAKPKVLEAIEGVKKKAGDDCKRYLGDGNWQEALARCEKYMKYACQDMSREQLYPPPNHVLVVRPGRLKRGQWRPRDPMYLRFLTAREKVDPGAPPWQCPVLPVVRKEKGPDDPRDGLRKALAQRFEAKELGTALLHYYDGKAPEAILVLQRLRERGDAAKWHQLADELRKDITTVDQLFKEAQTALQADDPEKAGPAFSEALTLDEKLMRDQAEKSPSRFRRDARQDMAAACYAKGKEVADRQDYRRACRVWKLGFSFYRGNTDLLRALQNVCTSKAGAAFEAATTCEALRRVNDFAVDGDGWKERAAARATELKCPEG